MDGLYDGALKDDVGSLERLSFFFAFEVLPFRIWIYRILLMVG